MGHMRDTPVREGCLGIWWIGQGGFAFKASTDKIVMVDPYLSYSMEGVTYIHSQLAVEPSEAEVDYVFCTHNHADHTDRPTLEGIASANPQAEFYGPTSSAKLMSGFRLAPQRIHTINRGETVSLPGRVAAQAVFAYHTPDSVGYILDLAGIRVYHSGDTEQGLAGYIDNMAQLEGLEPDIMVVCINPGYNNLGPREAAKLTELVDPKIVVPMHYDLIAENTVDPEEFLKALESLRVKSSPVVMTYGGFHLYCKT